MSKTKPLAPCAPCAQCRSIKSTPKVKIEDGIAWIHCPACHRAGTSHGQSSLKSWNGRYVAALQNEVAYWLKVLEAKEGAK